VLTLRDLYKNEQGPYNGMRLELLKFTKITNADPVQTTVQIFYDTELLADDEDQLINFNSNEYIPSYKKGKKETDISMAEVFKIPFHF
jgi:hypothetical protein